MTKELPFTLRAMQILRALDDHFIDIDDICRVADEKARQKNIDFVDTSTLFKAIDRVLYIYDDSRNSAV